MGFEEELQEAIDACRRIAWKISSGYFQKRVPWPFKEDRLEPSSNISERYRKTGRLLNVHEKI